jgi:hypothetical protein
MMAAQNVEKFKKDVATLINLAKKEGRELGFTDCDGDYQCFEKISGSSCGEYVNVQYGQYETQYDADSRHRFLKGNLRIEGYDVDDEPFCIFVA